MWSVSSSRVVVKVPANGIYLSNYLLFLRCTRLIRQRDQTRPDPSESPVGVINNNRSPSSKPRSFNRRVARCTLQMKANYVVGSETLSRRYSRSGSSPHSIDCSLTEFTASSVSFHVECDSVNAARGCNELLIIIINSQLQSWTNCG